MPKVISKKQPISFIIEVLFIILIFVCAMWNIAHTIPESFVDYDSFSSDLIVGRLIQDERFGIGSNSFLLGKYVYESESGNDETIGIEDLNYLDNIDLDSYEYVVYEHQFGLQGIIFSILNWILPFDVATNYIILQAFSALLSTIVLWYVVRYLCGCMNNNIGKYIFALIFIVFSTHFLSLMKNLYWVPWTFFLPMLGAIYMVKKNFSLKGWIVYFLTVVFRCCCGFEYISTILIASVIPVIIVSLKSEGIRVAAIKASLRNIFEMIFVSIAAFICTLIMSILQLGNYYGSIEYAFSEYLTNISRRTVGIGDMSSQGDAIMESLNASYFSVMAKYLKSPVLILIILTVVITVYALFQIAMNGKSKKTIMENENFLISILICWVSFLAPISWIILAKGHSYIHVSINLLLWNVPYSICAINCLVLFARHLIVNCRRSAAVLVCCGLCISFVSAFVIQIYTLYEYNNPLKIFLYQTMYYAESSIKGSLSQDIYVNYCIENKAYIDAKGSYLALLCMNGTDIYIDGVSYDYSIITDDDFICVVFENLDVDSSDLESTYIQVENR